MAGEFKLAQICGSPTAIIFFGAGARNIGGARAHPGPPLTTPLVRNTKEYGNLECPLGQPFEVTVDFWCDLWEDKTFAVFWKIGKNSVFSKRTPLLL